MKRARKAEDVVVNVAPGTVVREAGNDGVLFELLYPWQRRCCCLEEEAADGMLHFFVQVSK